MHSIFVTIVSKVGAVRAVCNRCVFKAEQAMGRWVMGQWVERVTFLDGSHGSWVRVR